MNWVNKFKDIIINSHFDKSWVGEFKSKDMDLDILCVRVKEVNNDMVIRLDAKNWLYNNVKQDGFPVDTSLDIKVSKEALTSSNEDVLNYNIYTYILKTELMSFGLGESLIPQFCDSLASSFGIVVTLIYVDEKSGDKLLFYYYPS